MTPFYFVCGELEQRRLDQKVQSRPGSVPPKSLRFYSVGPKPEDGDSRTISVLSRINKRQSTASEAESTKDGVKLGEERKVSYSSCVSPFFRGRKLI